MPWRNDDFDRNEFDRNGDYGSGRDGSGTNDVLTVLPRRLRELVEDELEDGETVRWLDRPIPRYFTTESIGAFLFAIPWTAFAVFWMFGAAGFKIPDFRGGPESFFCLFGLPFVLIGLAMLSSPLWARRKLRRTVYVITDRRAILFVADDITSYEAAEIGKTRRTQKADGSGDVFFAYVPQADKDGKAKDEDDDESGEDGFKNIRDVKTVERMLRDLAKTQATAGQNDKK